MLAARAAVAALATSALGAAGLTSACQPTIASLDWKCDFDASETRPLSDPDAAFGPDGSLPSVTCQTTCGTPALRCTFALLDGGVPGAVCPVCTF